MQRTNERRVAVLMGGVSREREVSLVTGEAVASALERSGHDVARAVLDRPSLEALDGAPLDAVFIALHGRFGEDGGVQRALEARGIPYTGSGPEASDLAFDKPRAKQAFEAAGLRTPRWVELPEPIPQGEALEAAIASVGLPCVLKPTREGSSIGVFIVRTKDDIAAAGAGLAEIGGPAMAEEFVPGRELTVGILEDRALPLVEVVPAEGFYDFGAKYAARSGTLYLVEPRLSGSIVRDTLDTALAAHRALGCRGASRVDIRLAPSGLPFLLEVNTIPGMTPTSLLPMAAKAAGIPFDDLCARLVRDALARATPARTRRAPRAPRPSAGAR